MANDSIHDKLNNTRKPRVHITYDIESNGAVEKKELPFIVGVMGDYSGDNTENKDNFKEREFVNVDNENFNSVMAKIAPSLNIQVDNTIEGGDKEMPVSLEFNSMEDFEPHRIAEQVGPLKQLLETRNKLRDMLGKVDRSADLEAILEDVLQNTEQLKALSNELGLNDSPDQGDK